MGNPRARYTLEFKLEAVRMVKGGQSLVTSRYYRQQIIQ